MNFLLLEYFVAVAEEKEISRAAKKLYITDQALSKQIKKLEEKLEEKLFERSRPLKLTAAGEIVYKDALQLLKTRDSMLQKLQKLKKQQVLRIGVMDFGIPSFLSELLVQYEKEHSDVEFSLVVLPLKEISHEDVADIYFLPGNIRKNMERILLVEDETCVVVAENLLKKSYGGHWKEKVRAMQKNGELRIIGDLPFAKGAEFFWKILQDEIVKQPDLQPETVNGEINLDMCRAGLRAIMMPYHEAKLLFGQEESSQEKSREKLYIFPLKNENSHFQFCVAYEKGKQLTDVQQTFIKMTIEYTSKLFEEVNQKVD